MKVIVVLPVHNDEVFVIPAIEQLIAKTKELVHKFLFIIAEDGSTDSSYQNSIAITKKYSNVQVKHFPDRLGRGRAVKKAFSLFEGDIYVFMDVDLATDLHFLHPLINSVQAGYDLATGSRYATGSVTKRPFLRMSVSLVYNLLIRIIFNTGVYDHQCGFKAFSKRFRDYLIVQSESPHWFWDTELFILARHHGYKISEIPIVWNEKKSERTPLKRLVKDVITHTTGTIRFLIRQK